jgi:UDP-glucuronate 4-epimerase
MGGIPVYDISDSGFTNSTKFGNYRFIRCNTCDRKKVEWLFQTEKFDLVCHLAAQAGVRYSIENPYSYIENNIDGFITILEGCRRNEVDKLVYASSSSVYGSNDILPFSEDHGADKPLSLYAATKRADEMIAYSYSHLYNIQISGLRLFTVYGPWGRPDMAPFIFSNAILKGEALTVYNNGDHYRDYTYIDDVSESIYRTLMNQTLSNDSGTEKHTVLNIGNNSPVSLRDFIGYIEYACGKTAIIKNMPMQPGDIHTTYADINKLKETVGYVPGTPIHTGIGAFIAWFRNYYRL